MFGLRTKLITIFGFDIKLDFSWIFIATLIVWSLATGYFPDQLEDLSENAYWVMAVIAMLGSGFKVLVWGTVLYLVGLLVYMLIVKSNKSLA